MPRARRQTLVDLLRTFAADVQRKLSHTLTGEPEEQLRTPFENFLTNAAPLFSIRLTLSGEARVAGLGKPDYAAYVDDHVLTGHVELKKVGEGARTSAFTGRNKLQWERFKSLPNLLYCDGNQWALYRDGTLTGSIVRLDGDVVDDGPEAVTESVARKLKELLTDFLSWEPIVPRTIAELAEQLAPRCRLLRDQVTDALQRPESPLVGLKRDWQTLLFPEANDEQFADAYAQTVTFALLLARAEDWTSESFDDAATTLRVTHGVMERALRVLTEPGATTDIDTALDVLRRIIGHVDPAVFRPRVEQLRLLDEVTLRAEDPWIYFYEDFLGAYDARMRKDAGVYYTPVEVVRLQVRLIDEILRKKLGRPLGFADPNVTTLDPAVGTGTYPLGVIDQALANVLDQLGRGALPGVATRLATQIFGFEKLAGPYSVAELRVSQALQRFHATLPAAGLNILMTDTLESPDGIHPHTPIFMRVIGDQHRRALDVKKKTPIIVCLGNPPYDRHSASADPADRAATGGWVRWGNDGNPKGAILEDFAKPARDAGHGADLKNLYNLYVYFWRWALWKTFECTTDGGAPDRPGVVSFISASSFLRGNAFVGLRRKLRELCDEVWIIDLGGEGRGTRPEDNVFAIQTPVCITIGMRSGSRRRSRPATVHYRRIRGTRAEKLQTLERLRRLRDAEAAVCDQEATAIFAPPGSGEYFTWPEIRNIYPWQHSGVEYKRTWPIAPTVAALKERWAALLAANDRAAAFRESSDRMITESYRPLPGQTDLTPISELSRRAPTPRVDRYAFRSFDRQFSFVDSRLAARPRPQLYAAHGPRQVFLSCLFNHPIGRGPALVASAAVPDRHCFRGSFGGRDAIPLFRDVAATQPNIAPGVFRMLERHVRGSVSAEDVLSYVYAILAQPAFSERFWNELETCEIRVPLTRDRASFRAAVRIGRRLLWLHTFGERLVPPGHARGEIPTGAARCVAAVPASSARYPESFDYDAAAREIRIGGTDLFSDPAGRFGPVAPEVWNFEVSGLKVVQSWLGYRMRDRKGKKSSPLDDIHPERWTPEFTTEFLNLLWILEHTIAGYPEQAELLDRICRGSLVHANDLPEAPHRMRRPPSGQDEDQIELDFEAAEEVA